MGGTLEVPMPSASEARSSRIPGDTVTWRIIMRATLHHRALNTYYGQWRQEKAAIYGHRIAVHCPQWNSREGEIRRRRRSLPRFLRKSRPGPREIYICAKNKWGCPRSFEV
jgi:hypothetical protein